jgi:hypothetical protein
MDGKVGWPVVWSIGRDVSSHRRGNYKFPTLGTSVGVTLTYPGRARAPTLSAGRLQEVEGTHEPWNPNGTRAGRCTVATGGPENDVASRITRSLASRVAS